MVVRWLTDWGLLLLLLWLMAWLLVGLAMDEQKHPNGVLGPLGAMLGGIVFCSLIAPPAWKGVTDVMFDTYFGRAVLGGWDPLASFLWQGATRDTWGGMMLLMPLLLGLLVIGVAIYFCTRTR